MKLSGNKKYAILKTYLAFLSWSSWYTSVKQIAQRYNVEAKRPVKIKYAFDKLWKALYANEEVNYKRNIFEERKTYTIHRNVTLANQEDMTVFLGKYPRAWRSTFCAWMEQHYKPVKMKRSTFQYHKPIILWQLWKKYKQKAHEQKKEATDSKKFFTPLYKKYDFIINVDGKSLEDIPAVQKNIGLKLRYKRVSLAVDIQSWALLKIGTEKSHNKTNAGTLIKECIETLKGIFWEHIRILFITDAGSEYLNNKKLRGMIVTESDTSKLVKYLKEQNCDLLITRYKEDNGYVENKNKYIEIACLDNEEICTMNEREFHDTLQTFMDLNNYFLRGSSEKVYRGRWKTPRDNLIARFWEEKTDRLLSNLSVSYLEGKHTLSGTTWIKSIYQLVQFVYPYLSRNQIQDLTFRRSDTFPKSIDSPKLVFVISFVILRSFGIGIRS